MFIGRGEMVFVSVELFSFFLLFFLLFDTYIT